MAQMWEVKRDANRRSAAILTNAHDPKELYGEICCIMGGGFLHRLAGELHGKPVELSGGKLIEFMLKHKYIELCDEGLILWLEAV